jgi:hypothetical protein
MDRRNFIQLGFAGIGSTIVAPRLVIASASEQSMAGGGTTPPMHLAAGARKYRRILQMSKSEKGKTEQ